MQPLCSRKTTLDVTESILFSASPRELVLKATDLEISFQSSLAIESSLTDPHSFLISGRRIFEVVRELSGTLTFEISNTQLRLGDSGGASFNLSVREEGDFPPFPERIENLMQLDAQFFVRLLNKVAIVIPQNNSNKALNGLFLEVGPDCTSLVGTDGHSLARALTPKYTLPEEHSWLIPRRSAFELKKVLEQAEGPVFLGTCSGHLVFSGSNFNFFTRLIADPFPNYRAILATDGAHKVGIKKEPLVKSLKRAGTLLAGQFISTKFSFDQSKLSLHIKNKEVGSLDDSIDVGAGPSDAVDVFFYTPYLLAGVQVFEEEDLSCSVRNHKSPLVFDGGGEEHSFVYLVMPVSRDAASNQ
jgi:DNA polymerase-3 subunit beta